ncbi:UbiA prenyltransferase family protein [uncultured archaeon]|nr:UbiA prenyltransferase family protein [uncultured archaeon]
MQNKYLSYKYFDNILRFDEWQEHSFSTNVYLIFLLFPFASNISAGYLLLVWAIIELIWLYSFMINDWYDKEVDRVAGKNKIMYLWSEKKAFSIYLIQITVGLLFALFLGFQVFIATLIAFLLVHIYSAPPRFKTRGILAPLELSTGYLMSIIIIVLTFGIYHPLLLPFTAMFVLSVVTDNLRHHIKDHNTDEKTIKTFVTESGVQRTEKILKIVDIIATISVVSIYAVFSYSLYAAGSREFATGIILLFISWFLFVYFYVSRDIHRDISRTLMNQRFTLLVALIITIYINQPALYLLLVLSFMSSKLFLKRALRQE